MNSDNRKPMWIVLLLGICTVSACKGYAVVNPTVNSLAIEKLRFYEGKDLAKRGSAASVEVAEILDTLAVSRSELAYPVGSLARIWPWRVWKGVGPGMDDCLIILEGGPLLNLPGNSSASIHVLRMDGTVATTSTFSTGWRADLMSAKFITTSPIGVPLIVLTTTKDFDAPPITQYYFQSTTGCYLIRLEDSHGTAIANHFGAPNWTIGPPSPVVSIDRLRGALFSAEPAEILTALIWIGGTHYDTSVMPQPNTIHENLMQADTCERARKLPDVIRRIEALSNSSNAWIREAAQLSLRPTKYW